MWLEEDPEENGVEDLFHGLPANSKSACLSLEKASYSSWAATRTVPPWSPYTQPPKWQPIIRAPCCDTYCNIQASAAQLYYWPPTLPAPNATTVTGEGGFI